MARLLLVKHALPEIQPDVPAKRWRLGEQGRTQSARLAEALRPCNPSVVISSDEPKAAETGRIAAEVLGLACYEAPGLHENDRTGFPYFDDFNDLEPFAFWQNWPLGTFAVLSRPDYGIIEKPRALTGSA